MDYFFLNAGSSSACDGGAASFSAGSSSLGAGGVLKLAVRGRQHNSGSMTSSCGNGANAFGGSGKD